MLLESAATAGFESAARAACHELDAVLLGLALCKNPFLLEGGSGGKPAGCCKQTALRLAKCNADDEREKEGGAPDAKDCPASAAMTGDEAGCMRGEAETGCSGAVKG
jgi:hypothetical protein